MPSPTLLLASLSAGGRDDAVHAQIFHELAVVIGDVPDFRGQGGEAVWPPVWAGVCMQEILRGRVGDHLVEQSE